MARRAPAVERAIGILNFLASRPSDRFTLSEIARELDLNKATLHAILGALAGAGYLVRDDDRKTYGLGPTLVALGNAALDGSSAVHLALPEMERLTGELGLHCVASAAIGDEIVILARTGTPRPFGIDVRPGQRLPLAPPLGTVFVAWSDEERVEAWLGRSGSKSDVARYREAVESVRERGYSVGVEGVAPARPPGRRRDRLTLEEGVRSVRVDEYAVIDIDESASYRLNHVGAPVFGPDGDVLLAMFLIGFQGEVAGEMVPRLAERLRLGAARVTEAIGGREPGAA